MKDAKKPEVEEHVKKTCFVITPIGPDGSQIRRNADGVIDSVIRPVLEAMGYQVEAAHHISTPGSITEQVLQRVIDSDIVIANLTTLNANVMYELAVRHCVGKPVISIVEIGTALPFDIADERTIFFANDMAGVHELKARIGSVIAAANSEAKSDSPVSRASRASVFNVNNGNADRESVMFESIQRLESMTGRLANQLSALEGSGIQLSKVSQKAKDAFPDPFVSDADLRALRRDSVMWDKVLKHHAEVMNTHPSEIKE